MPTPEEIYDDKVRQMAAKSASDASSGLVIPRFQLVDIPSRVVKAYPELALWHRENHAAMEDWRQKTNVALARGITDTTAQLPP